MSCSPAWCFFCAKPLEGQDGHECLQRTRIFDPECSSCGKVLSDQEMALAVDSDGRRMMCCPTPACMHPTLEVALASFARTALWLERAKLRLLEQTPVKGFH